ncbi:MAG: DHH family phosphoesterase, partial [Clostridiales bacterium]|nr:DHH family phosphoesterase [Clostridiales bacterium]
MNKWMLRQAAVNVAQLAAEWNLHPVQAHILAVRGFRHKREVESFLHASDMTLPSPTEFADMTRALELVSEAIAAKQHIAIFGDYDADGIVSTVILYKSLTMLNANVTYYIPQRESEGYGLNNEAIFALKQKQVELIIACDNGVSAFEQVIYANSLGISVVILDHHDIPLTATGEQMLVPAAAIVDAKRQDCRYPFKLYCAAGVCYRFSEAIYRHLGIDWSVLAEELLPLAALATICDLVDLTGENRALVQRGLPAIAASNNPGLAALRQATGVEGLEIGVYHVGFRLGPCVNASGRLEDAALAVELFLTDDAQRAMELAIYLANLNNTRKALTEQGVNSALATIEQQNLAADKIILVHCLDIYESVAGIVAGKIKELYH